MLKNTMFLVAPKGLAEWPRIHSPKCQQHVSQKLPRNVPASKLTILSYSVLWEVILTILGYRKDGGLGFRGNYILLWSTRGWSVKVC